MLVQSRLTAAAAFAVLLGSLALATPAHAAPFSDNSGPPNSSITLDSNGHIVGRTSDTSEAHTVYASQQPAPAPMRHHPHPAKIVDKTGDTTASTENPDEAGVKPGHMCDNKGGPHDMSVHVEHRIKELHDRLGITKDQESAWYNVAQAMRENEGEVSNLIRERHENAGQMNAVDDLESYQTIAQAHADGLANVNAAFKNLYADMSDAQRKNADVVFSHYEGHGEPPHGKHHHGHHGHAEPKPAPAK